MIRMILCALWLFLLLVVGLIPLLFYRIIGGKNVDRYQKLLFWHLKAGLKVLLFLAGAKVEEKCVENRAPEDQGPFLYIVNHQSIFDVIVLYTRMKKPPVFVAKKELSRVPLLSFWLRRMRTIFLDRSDIKKGLEMIMTAIDEVKAGRSVCIFPEGTRNRGEDKKELLPFHQGSLKIADRTNILIQPMALSNTSKLFEDHIPFIKKTKVVLNYRPAFRLSSLTREEKKTSGELARQMILPYVEG